MVRSLVLVLLFFAAGPLLAQTAPSDDTVNSGETEATGNEGGRDGTEVAASADSDGGVETGRPVPASPEGIKGLENPDASAFAAKREENPALLADRQSPAGFPTLEQPDDDGGALDGAARGETLEAKRDDEDARALFTALSAMNCRIAAREVADRLGPLGFEPQTVTSTLATLYVEGVASQDSLGYLSLPASICPPDRPAPSPRDRVISAIRENGCTVDERALRVSSGISDLSDAQLLAILGPMRERGEIETGAQTATLSQELCQED